MTSRERLVAVASGEGTDQKPVISLAGGSSDAVFDSLDSERISLKSVLNPFGQAMKQDVALWEILEADPEEGECVLHGFVTKSKAEIREALEEGYDGVLYYLVGATSEHTTPMEYGGHYLERDREILSEVASAAFNMVFVVGEEAYLDFVSDLPAHAFGWESLSDNEVDQVRELRQGALCTNSKRADIILELGELGMSRRFESNLRRSYAI